MNANPRVLIVDDEERFRVTLKKLLSVRDITPHAVGSGIEALQELENNAYDVILLDVKMPGMSGIEALSQLKAKYPDVEVIILTGHASVDAAVEIMRLGGYDYLLKPCPIDELTEKITSAYEKKINKKG